MAHYPLPVFHFRVQWGGTRLWFSEVSGLDIENQAVEYRDDPSPADSAVKMPGIARYGKITLKRGVISDDNALLEWLDTTRMNEVERRDLLITLLNENLEPVATWTAVNAFPVKIDGPFLKATGNEVAIESIEIAHEGLRIER